MTLGKVTATSTVTTFVLLLWTGGRTALDITGASLDGLSILLFVSTIITTLLLFAWGIGLDLPDKEE